ncbi:hypothetical protein PUNSTDRAFT_120603 [Punctularia strigosozonata HHB-11173 SS5]|uniref:uncharacterized protein n=1 Tax=Punctularia strigosozonata (strain HHB-11173) TaxID=741275 RepID=UPI0004416D9D|nr:uncharacterized protein PUNSTDRAFT_120603 [Punctularia strigosozonata HHB-11173 SS5]EIN09368.1 hypothetical protein PUNSTDRAFT_120603 [Punctularia strigosozonata HHB-11173 SS5]
MQRAPRATVLTSLFDMEQLEKVVKLFASSLMGTHELYAQEGKSEYWLAHPFRPLFIPSQSGSSATAHGSAFRTSAKARESSTPS